MIVWIHLEFSPWCHLQYRTVQWHCATSVCRFAVLDRRVLCHVSAPTTLLLRQQALQRTDHAGGNYPASLVGEAFQIEHDLGSGLGSEDPSIRAQFRQMYDRKMGETRRERLLFIVREQAWIGNAHNFWVRHALGLMLTLLDTDRRLNIAKTACQGVPVVPLEPRPAEVKREALLGDVPASMKAEPSGRSTSGALEPLGPAFSEHMPALLGDTAAPDLTGSAHVRIASCQLKRVGRARGT